MDKVKDKMIIKCIKQRDSEIFRKALGRLLKKKDYHVASPTKKNEMLKKEYTKILQKLKGSTKK